MKKAIFLCAFLIGMTGCQPATVEPDSAQAQAPSRFRYLGSAGRCRFFVLRETPNGQAERIYIAEGYGHVSCSIAAVRS